MANEKTATAAEPKPNFQCRILNAKDLALEKWTPVQAQTPADAKEVYLKEMGINALDHPLKVEVQGV